MELARYWLAFLAVVTFGPALAFWFIIHPFVRFWRRLGAGWTYGIALGLLAMIGLTLYLTRTWLLAIDFGFHPILFVAGVGVLVAAATFRAAISRHLGVPVLVGLPELDPSRHPSRLLTEGIYARVRHPRYIQLILGLLGLALLANYLAPYVVLALWIPGAWIIAVLEEKELRERFGKEYESYSRRVPRFFPRL